MYFNKYIIAFSKTCLWFKHVFYFHLVPDWKQAYKWISVHAMLWASVIQIVWFELPEEMKASVSPKIVSILTVVLLVLGIGGRIINQNIKPTNKTEV